MTLSPIKVMDRERVGDYGDNRLQVESINLLGIKACKAKRLHKMWSKPSKII